jgi:hypothetical protein
MRKAPHQIPDPEFAQDTSQPGIVNSAMGEKVLVLRGEDRTANDGRDLLIPGDLTVFGSDLNERPVGDIVDVANCGKVKPIEGLQVG